MEQSEESIKMRELRLRTGMTKKEFTEYFNIPYYTYQKWELGARAFPQYVYELMEYKLKKEGMITEDAGRERKGT